MLILFNIFFRSRGPGRKKEINEQSNEQSNDKSKEESCEKSNENQNLTSA